MSSWIDLVFHVLAHVEGTAGLAASNFDPVYVAFAETLLGPASDRTLGGDRSLLAAALPTHARLARAQLVAWLFADLDQAVACGARDLRDLRPEDVARPWLLQALVAEEAGVELLRGAALLEAGMFARLPRVVGARSRLEPALVAVRPAAPALGVCSVRCVRSLRLRGRVLREGGRATIWVGAPGEAPALAAGHAAWQAAHEATVDEVTQAAQAARFEVVHEELEHAAIVLLAGRAARTGRTAGHQAWLERFAAPSSDPETLSPAWRELVGELFARA
jgi:hypothetical protein